MTLSMTPPMTPDSLAIAPILIRGAQVLLPSGAIEVRDVAIAGGHITAVGTDLPTDASTRVIAAQGLTLLPGVIDPQVHFCTSGEAYGEALFTETCAAAKGGVTSFLEIPNTPPITTTQAVVTRKLAIAEAQSLINYGFFIGATHSNHKALQVAKPTCGIHVTMGAGHSPPIPSPLLVDTLEALEPIFATGDRLIAVHAENQARITERAQQFALETDPATHTRVQDNQTALLATKIALGLSKAYQRRLHILQVSTGEEADLLRSDKPSWVSTSVSPQHLLLDMSAYETMGTLAQTNPPLRYARDRDLLWQALNDGIIDFIATGHVPHSMTAKSRGYPHAPSGMPGVETALPLMLTQTKKNHCTIAQVCDWMSTAVADAYRIPNKGLLEPGYDADLVLVDMATYRPVVRKELQTRCQWSPFEGWNLTGWPVMTIVGGQVVYDYGQVDVSVRGQALQFG
ncbi:MAG: dihydroorotase [Cyanobacteria bacterium J06581_3]